MPIFTFLLFFILSNHSLLTAATGNATTIANSTTAPPPPLRTSAAFKPGIAAVVGILTTTFSITFLLLLYVKHCKGSSYGNASRGYPPSRRNSGINRKVIESLPMFRFSSLRGHKDGLECAVCLNKFEAEEVLRLLPKCKHAFHVECVDTWLEAHSTCPLCRYRVDPEDVLLVDTSALATPRASGAAPAPAPAPRVSGRHSSAGERGTALEIIAENPRDDLLRGRVSLDSWNSRRKTGAGSGGKMLDRLSVAENPGRRGKAGRKDGQLPVQGDKHRLEHRIIISGGGEGLRRWSDVQAADLLYLGSEMLLGGEEGESGSGVINGRSVSEITGMSRYRGNNGGKEERERQEEGVVNRWLAWISQSQHHHNPAVQSATSAAASSPIVL
ncbi:RING-H2 finger protein ATL43-like [Salvia miltiorrhiza]|uniref:RING-H2 finger protein ATL43-like n=1 Tax=Salvia miltiorrhiza TaxID=226208 RepID=UPI0025AB8B23|nr:RING-H2 finger protein ATL43-like [Salvia miltiorrhiza]